MTANSNSIKLVYLFRHGETDWNRAARVQGHADIALNDAGREQARILAESLRGEGIELVLSSDLERARETAAAVANATGVPMIVDADLRETHIGQAEGLTGTEIIAHFGEDAWRRWHSLEPEGWTYAFPGGETKAQAHGRMKSALERLLLSVKQNKIAVCSHGGVLRRFIHRIKPELQEPVSIGNCHLFLFTFDPGSRAWTALF